MMAEVRLTGMFTTVDRNTMMTYEDNLIRVPRQLMSNLGSIASNLKKTKNR